MFLRQPITINESYNYSTRIITCSEFSFINFLFSFSSNNCNAATFISPELLLNSFKMAARENPKGNNNLTNFSLNKMNGTFHLQYNLPFVTVDVTAVSSSILFVRDCSCKF